MRHTNKITVILIRHNYKIELTVTLIRHNKKMTETLIWHNYLLTLIMRHDKKCGMIFIFINAA